VEHLLPAQHLLRLEHATAAPTIRATAMQSSACAGCRNMSSNFLFIKGSSVTSHPICFCTTFFVVP
jgi:hypothetical protein